MEFNIEQTDAINSISGPVMVISCPGSGKTSVLVERTNKIIQSGVSSNRILVATFSKPAATEMKEKFQKKHNNGDVKFLTIHAVCYKILENEIGLTRTSVLDDPEKEDFFRDIYAELEKKDVSFKEQYNDFDNFYTDMKSRLGRYKILKYRDSLLTQEKLKTDDYVGIVYSAYERFKNEVKKIDFDDMIIECHKCLKDKSDLLANWQKEFEYIMIDEYQDTNVLQAEIFFMLAGKTKNICVVGDDDQSIYSFRDSDSMIFKKFSEEYPERKEIRLKINYRSKPKIVKLASCLIRHNLDRMAKEFQPNKKGDSKVETATVDGGIGQATEVVRIIEEYKKKNIPLKSIAILFRVKKEASLVCNRLQAEKIPFFTKDLPKDLHNEMVFKDIKAYYRLANDLWGNTDLSKIINRPKRYIKKEAVMNCGLNKAEILKKCTRGVQDGEKKEQINKVIEQLFYDLKVLRGKKPSEFMKYLKDNMKYRDALEDHANYFKIEPKKILDQFDELLIESEKFDTMVEWDNYASECRKLIKKEMEKNKEKGVYLSTFHSSKGLEWDNVIIISANDGVTPLKRGREEIENPEEERRLFYVAMTRAAKELTILYFKSDSVECISPTRYIAEMYSNPTVGEEKTAEVAQEKKRGQEKQNLHAREKINRIISIVAYIKSNDFKKNIDETAKKYNVPPKDLEKNFLKSIVPEIITNLSDIDSETIDAKEEINKISYIEVKEITRKILSSVAYIKSADFKKEFEREPKIFGVSQKQMEEEYLVKVLEVVLDMDRTKDTSESIKKFHKKNSSHKVKSTISLIIESFKPFKRND